LRLRICWAQLLYGDYTIFISKRFFDRIGGYPEIPIMEDITFIHGIRKIGGKIVILNARAFTSARRWEREGILSRTLRNWILMLLDGYGVKAAVLARFSRPYGS
jgi:hypothetical protein